MMPSIKKTCLPIEGHIKIEYHVAYNLLIPHQCILNFFPKVK